MTEKNRTIYKREIVKNERIIIQNKSSERIFNERINQKFLKCPLNNIVIFKSLLYVERNFIKKRKACFRHIGMG